MARTGAKTVETATVNQIPKLLIKTVQLYKDTGAETHRDVCRQSSMLLHSTICTIEQEQLGLLEAPHHAHLGHLRIDFQLHRKRLVACQLYMSLLMTKIGISSSALVWTG